MSIYFDSMTSNSGISDVKKVCAFRTCKDQERVNVKLADWNKDSKIPKDSSQVSAESAGLEQRVQSEGQFFQLLTVSL